MKILPGPTTSGFGPGNTRFAPTSYPRFAGFNMTDSPAAEVSAAYFHMSRAPGAVLEIRISPALGESCEIVIPEPAQRDRKVR
jgi:hypothetical protein